jgi:hypothetical protein
MSDEGQLGERFDVVVPKAFRTATSFGAFSRKALLFAPSAFFTGLLIFWVATEELAPHDFWFWFYIAFIGMWFVIARVGLNDMSKIRPAFVEVRSDAIVVSFGANPMSLPLASIARIEHRDEYTAKEKIHESIWTGRADVAGPHVAIWRVPRKGIARLFRGTGEVERFKILDEGRFLQSANSKLSAYRAEHPFPAIRGGGSRTSAT